MYLFGLLAVLVAIFGPAATLKHGTIGYGINMYLPWCCTACHDSLSALYLSCTTFTHSSEHDGMSTKVRKRMTGMEMLGSTSNACYASNLPYQESFAYCVKSHCDAEGIADDLQDRCFQKNAAGGLFIESLQHSLPQIPPTEELAKDDIWLNKTMLVNGAHWASGRRTIEAFERVEDEHSAFSIGAIVLGVGVPIAAGCFVLLSGLLPMSIWQSRIMIALQSRFALPALFDGRHSQPLPGRIGYLPTRPVTVFVALYIVLNIIFSAVPYHSVQPNTWYANRNQEISAYIANRTGVLSFANMALSILFSTRNNPLLYLSGWSTTTFLTLHRWTGRVAMLHAVIHSLVYTIDYTFYYPGSEYDANVSKAYFWWGIIATTSMALMAGLSSLPFRARAYEFFLILHIILALLSLLGSWYHVDIRFDKQWGYEVWLYIAFAFWMYDRAIRLGKVVYYNVFSASTAEVKMVPGTRFVMLTLRIKRQWSVRPGMHTYVYFPSLGRFWENHPFTIADWGFEVNRRTEHGAITATEAKDADVREVQIQESVQQAPPGQTDFYVRCLFRIQSGTTAKLYNKLSSHPLKQSYVLTEGPYGGHALSHHNLKTAEKVLCIAGGIGITFAAGFARQFGGEHGQRESGRRRSVDHPVVGAKPVKKMMPRCRQFTLAWSVREKVLLDLVRRDMLPDLSSGGFDDGSMKYRIWLTRKHLGAGKHLSRSLSSAKSREVHATVTQTEEHVSMGTGQRMNVAELLSSYVEKDKRHVVLVCGPGALADEVRQQVVQCARRGHVIDLIEESFAW